MEERALFAVLVRETTAVLVSVREKYWLVTGNCYWKLLLEKFKKKTLPAGWRLMEQGQGGAGGV